MSRAAADKQEERAQAFKAGLGAGLTDKRANEASTLRKKKHEFVMSRKRGVTPVPSDEGATRLARMLALYNRDALLGGDIKHLRLLHDILERATTPLLDAQVPTLVNKAVIALLVKHVDQEECVLTLRHLTGTATCWDNDIAKFTVDAGFLERMAEGDNARNPNCWDVLQNILAVGGKQACKLVLGSSLFARGVVQGLVPNMVQSDQWMPVVCMLILELNNEDKITWPLVEWCWPLVVDVLAHRVPAMQWIELDDSHRKLVNCATLIVNQVLAVVGVMNRGQLSLTLLFQPRAPQEAPAIVPILRQLLALLRQAREPTVEVRVLEIMTRLAALELEQTHDIAIMMHEAGCVRDMLVHASSTSSVARHWAMQWMGNYMMDGTQFTRHLLEAGAMPILVQAMERGEMQIKADAIYVVMTAFKVCQNDSLNGQVQPGVRALANETLHSLVVGHHIFSRLTEHLGLLGMDVLSANILTCLRCALEWNRAVTLDSLRAYKVHARIEDMVADLKTARNTALYEVAVEVDDLLQGRSPENREAALEAAAAAAQGWSMDTSADNPALLMGRFEF